MRCICINSVCSEADRVQSSFASSDHVELLNHAELYPAVSPRLCEKANATIGDVANQPPPPKLQRPPLIFLLFTCIHLTTIWHFVEFGTC